MSLAKVDSPVKEGEVIASKYRVERVLGVGGMGVVVAARHLELGELFALKFLLPTARTNKEVAARFGREARTGIRIRNEHVARVFDVGTLPDGAPYMVMEHLTGEDVAALIDRRGPLPVAEAIDLLLQACEALSEAHGMRVVHRDLKPANLFVTTGSEGLPFVKVLDFGISKTVGGDDQSVTATAAILGSPLYMSPEQLTASRDVDQRTDMWSLGVILYEMLTQETPFNGATFPVLCASILGGSFKAASALQPTIPSQVDAIISALLVSDRAARLSSVAELAKQLAPFGSDHASASYQRIVRISARAQTASPSAHDVGSALALADTEDQSPAAAADPHPTDHSLSRTSHRARGSRVALSLGGALVVATVGVYGWTALRRGRATPTASAASAGLASVTGDVGKVAPVPTAAPESPLPAGSSSSVASVAPSASAPLSPPMLRPNGVASGATAKSPARDIPRGHSRAAPPASSAATPDSLFDGQK